MQNRYMLLTAALLLTGAPVISDVAALPQVVQAATTAPASEEVSYQIDKAGTTTASLANGFFTGQATVATQADGTRTVTLHLKQFASMIKTFAIGDQQATITNATANTADLTFTIDASFATATVAASMNVMNMTQQADIVFAKPLYIQPALPDLSQPGTYRIAYAVDKKGTTTPSLAAAFFTGEATVVVATGKPTTVTLHMAKNANMIKSFAIGEQTVAVTNLAGGTGDLTFTVDDSFKAATVTATMSMAVINMTQQADLVFAQPLQVAPAPTDAGQTGATTGQTSGTTTGGSTGSAAGTTGTEGTTPATSTPVSSTTTQPATTLANNEATARIYQANQGQLTHQPSAAQSFLATTVRLATAGSRTTVTLHTTGAEYIRQMQVLGQLVRVLNQHGNAADLVFTVPTAALKAALPVSFALTIPGGVEMNQAAFLLIDLPISQAKAYAPAVASASATALSAGLTAAPASVHALDATKAVQYVSYSVLNSGRSAASAANSYFTHQAKVVKTASGFMVYLTVKAPAGVVNFTPLSVNGAGVSAISHTQSGGQDTWTFAFPISSVDGLTKPLAGQILMSVPVAGISNQTFSLWFVFNAAAGATTKAATKKAAALKPTVIHRQQATKNKATAATVLPATVKLPKLKHYPVVAEAAGFAAVSLAIIGWTAFTRRRLRKGEHQNA